MAAYLTVMSRIGESGVTSRSSQWRDISVAVMTFGSGWAGSSVGEGRRVIARLPQVPGLALGPRLEGGALSRGLAEFAAAFMDHLGLAGVFERMDIAEDENAAARMRYPDASDRLYRSFMLLVPSRERMEYEPVY
ncbi:hypothetical protein [Glycomyces terrestris]|uniref:Uncharacterized protein n=1 Tax=Glycomyces terrestris TaxID=2493553 RepID=A0A426V0Q3_9ACTN|nr:hypothetical protein [Glycomyces terrestris]RRS00426.1 hypothetical protein EIW28_07615 [Glycomyces terrestris]